MTRLITIRIELDVPDGVEVRVGPVVPDADPNEPLPLPEWLPPNGSSPERSMPLRNVVAVRAAPGEPLAASSMCPMHRVTWRVVPAGVSKKTGKPYGEFRACPEVGCAERPR